MSQSGGLFAKFATVGGATMASRVLGFAREAMIAAVLGIGPVADVFYTCFRFPNLFRRLFAEGAFNIAFVPLFAKELEAGGEEAANRFGQDVFAVLSTWLMAFTILALLIMPFLVSTVVAPGFTDNPEKFDLAVVMTRIMFPYLFCMSLVAMFSGILNSLRRYFLAAIVPVLLNIVLIIVLAGLTILDITGRDAGVALAWGVFVSGVVQLGFLYLGVRKEGLSFRFSSPKLSAPVRRLLVLMGPGLLTGGVLQINLLIGTIIATAQDGANALLNFADRINQLPLGVIGIAVGVVLLPELSRALKAGDHQQVEHLQNRSLEFVLALTLPAAIGFILLPDDIVRLLYERGAFDEYATQQTALALTAFALGLPAYVMTKVFQPAFFSREDMRTPFWFSVIMVLANIILSLTLFPILGHVAIALSTAVSAWLNIVLLAGTQWRRGDFRPDGATLKRLSLILFGNGLLAATILALRPYLAYWLENGALLTQALALSVLICVSAIVYFAFCFLTGAIDMGQLRRFKRG